ncbi:PRC-barrel domain-containing protein [Candidatus Woesearchaeota archaeon]|nr:PRC-barrel domain-containing protein [Candidatus Woesearchaeota archaeon]
MAEDDKRYARQIIGKIVVTKSGKRFGEVSNISFETRTGELIHIILRNPTTYAAEINLEKNEKNELTIPYSSVIAVGDFVVVAEEDII